MLLTCEFRRRCRILKHAIFLFKRTTGPGRGASCDWYSSPRSSAQDGAVIVGVDSRTTLYRYTCRTIISDQSRNERHSYVVIIIIIIIFFSHYSKSIISYEHFHGAFDCLRTNERFELFYLADTKRVTRRAVFGIDYVIICLSRFPWKILLWNNGTISVHIILCVYI